MKNILILVSGNGGNFKFIFYLIEKKFINDAKVVIIADRECRALKFARDNDVENYIVNYSRDNVDELHKIVESRSIDLVITTWHKILDDGFVEAYKGKIINNHYSLLPSYAGLIGLHPVKKAINNGFVTGVTCHHVTANVDGGPIISQAIVKVLEEKSQQDIFDEVFLKGAVCLLFGLVDVLNIKIKIPKESVSCKKSSFEDDFVPVLGEGLSFALSISSDWLSFVRHQLYYSA